MSVINADRIHSYFTEITGLLLYTSLKTSKTLEPLIIWEHQPDSTKYIQSILYFVYWHCN